jgi:transposase-like protein
MSYEPFPAERFFTEITTEAEARALLWRSRFQGKDFDCPQCHSEEFYALRTRPEVRTCKGCRRQLRLRAGTIFESSKTSLLLWVKALFYVMQGKRGMSAQELQRHLNLKSYGRVWSMLQKIRAALQHRDAGYQVGDGVIELDAGTFGRQETSNQCDVLVAIETKAWVDAQGRERSRAGFAKVLVGKETKVQAQQLVDTGVRAGAMVNTDGSWSFRNVGGVDVDYQVVSGNPEARDRWLPWVHKFISNAKAWINGMHHGVKDKHMGRYVGEYTYRFNRRHDVPRLFHRALVACALAPPVKLYALC